MNSSSSSTEFQQDTIEENATERNMVGVGLTDIPLDSNTNNNLLSASSYAPHQRSFQESSHQQMPSAASAVGDLPASLLLQLQQRQQNQMQLDLLQQQKRRNEMGEQQLVLQQLLQLTEIQQRMQLLQQHQQQQAPMLLNHVVRNSGSSSFNDGTVPALTGNDKNDLLRSLTTAALQLSGKSKSSVSTCTNGFMPPSNDFLNNIANFTAGAGFNFPITTSSSVVDLTRSHHAADLLSSRSSVPSNIVLNRVISRLTGVAVPGLGPPAQESYLNDSTTNYMVADLLTAPGTATRKRKAPKNKNRVRRKKPKDHPSRPLSAYNLFFKDERRRILGIQGEDDEKLPDSGENTTSTVATKTSSAIEGNKEQDESDRNKAMKSGPDSKISDIEHATRKKVGFENLAKEIGARWRKITPERLEYYKAIAMKDQQRYTKEMKVREEKLIQLREEEKKKLREEEKKKLSEEEKKILKDAAQREQKEKEEGMPKRVTIQKEGKKEEEEDGHAKKNQEAANEGDEGNGAEDKALLRGDKEIHHATENGGNPMSAFVSIKRQCSSSFVDNSTSSDQIKSSTCFDGNQDKGNRDSSITVKEPAIARIEPPSSEIQELTASAPAAAGSDNSFPDLPPNEIVLNLPAQDTNGIDLNLPAQDTNLAKLAQEIKNLSDLQELCATTNNTSPRDQLHNSFLVTSVKNQEHQDGNTLQSEQIKLHLQQEQLLNTLKNSQKTIGGGGGDTSKNISRSCAIQQQVLEQSTMQRQYEDLLTSQRREKLNDRNSHHLLHGLSATAVGTNARRMPSLLEQQLASLFQSQLNQHPGDLISNATKEGQQSNHQQDSLQRLLQQNMMLGTGALRSAGLTATRSAATEHHTPGLLYGDGTTTNSATAISGGGQVEGGISGASTSADILHFGNIAGRNATTRGFKNSSILGTNNMNHHLLTNNALKESGVGMSTSTEQHHGRLDATNAGKTWRNQEIDLLLHRLLSEGGQNKSGDSNQNHQN